MTNGNTFSPTALWLDAWRPDAGANAQALCGKLSVDANYDDIVLWDRAIGRWYVAWNWANRFEQANGPGTNGSWLENWAQEDGATHWQAFLGDGSGDGTPDVIVYTPVSGRWFVAYTQSQPQWHFAQADGQEIYGSWLNGWGVDTDGFPKTEPEQNLSLPKVTALSQNYPNPFNAATVISYTLPKPSHVRVDIYNLLGQKATTLVDASQEAGEHQVIWNAGGQPSGVYFYRIVTEDNAETMKMLLLK
jgi:hypothetical protein